MKKKMTLINERISIHEKMKTSEKAIKIAVMIKRNGSAQSVFWKLVKNMKPKKEEASAIKKAIKKT